MKRLNVDDVIKEIGNKIDFFICSASFEGRCLSLAELARKNNPQLNSLIFVSGKSERVTGNLEKLRSILEKSSEVQLSVSSPTFTADAVVSSLTAMLVGKEGNLLLDITTFTHEQLLIVVRFIANLIFSGQTNVSVTIAYTGAEQYGKDAGDKMWLSRGVRQIRPVLGYSGRFRTGLATQLIILVGFEHERARAAVEYIEPSTLSLGVGTQSNSISPELAGLNSLFCEKILEFTTALSSTFLKIEQFDVSLVNAEETCESILKTANSEKHNVIVCPMNTKISTLGAAMAAMSDPRIQIMYVEPLEYNEEGYSIASSSFRIGQFSPKIRQP